MNSEIKDFATDTRKVKRVFLGLAVFLAVTILLIGMFKRISWNETLAAAFVVPFVFLAIVWSYGVAAMFDRHYTISDSGITLSRSGREIEHIAWQDIGRISRGHLRIKAKDGRRISFNLPPSVQTEILRTIEARLKGYNVAA